MVPHQHSASQDLGLLLYPFAVHLGYGIHYNRPLSSHEVDLQGGLCPRVNKLSDRTLQPTV